MIMLYQFQKLILLKYSSNALGIMKEKSCMVVMTILLTMTGYALFVNETLVSEAYASIGTNIAEIGVITADKYKGKGYATQVVSFMISELAKRNICPEWSCNIDNTASLKTGLKLGFEIADYYTLLVPNCGNVLCSIW